MKTDESYYKWRCVCEKSTHTGPFLSFRLQWLSVNTTWTIERAERWKHRETLAHDQWILHTTVKYDREAKQEHLAGRWISSGLYQHWEKWAPCCTNSGWLSCSLPWWRTVDSQSALVQNYHSVPQCLDVTTTELWCCYNPRWMSCCKAYI